VANEFAAYVQLNPQLPDEVASLLSQAEHAGETADIVAAHLMVSNEDKQALLETASVEERLLKLLELLAEENAVLAIEQEIAEKVQHRIEQTQRQMVLHERLRVLRDELEEGSGDEVDEIQRYRELLAEKRLSPATQKVVEKELRKLRQAPSMSPEVSVIRGLLDTVLDLPWGVTAPSLVDVAAVSRQLNRTHYGLKDVKDRVLEYLAVCRLLGADQPATIICLVGPPGTGKSSVARSVADALKRPFARISLGGVRDEAEIRGHRRTYIGAMPGRIIEAIVKACVDNPVVLLDEIDKMDHDWRGNPAAALMEVLDPAQNTAFRDNYLEVDYDLSKVLFIATANEADDIPLTLFDRLEVIPLSGYTMAEKLAIARRHLVPRVAAETGLERGDVRVSPATLRAVVREYTREAGVRDLERALRRVHRKVARRHLEDGLALPFAVRPEHLHDLLGEAHFRETSLPSRPVVGQSLGLAYTMDGGEVLTIEASISRGRGELLLTGQLGDVMQESASAAWGYLLANVEHDPQLKPLLKRSPYVAEEGLSLANHDVRVHVPEGAVPKDGPSAGLALAVALFSALTRAAIKPRVALTGEITLSGRILRIGGLKEKCLAAVRGGVKTVVLPEANRPSVAELPAELREPLEFVYVRRFTDALPAILA
jgi:ATP-dependent Lon protease